MARVEWQTPAGNLGTIPEGVFYALPLVAVDPLEVDTVYYQVIAGQLPAGIWIDETGILTGVPRAVATIQGIPAQVAADITSKFAVRAYTETTVGSMTVIKSLADRTFTITVTGQNTPEFVTPPGNIATYYDGSLVTDLQIEIFDPDIYAVATVSLAAGSLPPGLTLAPDGKISGFISPNTSTNAIPGFSRDRQGFDQYRFDFPTESSSLNYEFTLRVSNGLASNLRTFDIFVYSRNSMTADNVDITADNTFITADVSPQRPPIILTPSGSIGTTRSDNFYAFQFQGVDLDGNPFEFIALDSLPPGLALDPNSGWLYGYIPELGLAERTYSFDIIARKTGYPDVFSNVYNYSLTITRSVNNNITWLVPSNLGSIDNGSVSIFYIAAINTSNIPLQYRLLSGSDSLLPQGLQLLPSGEIAGRVSFNNFELDNGTTTFDAIANPHYNPNNNPTTGINHPTTFDLVFTFTVNAYSTNGLVNTSKVFSITVVQKYTQPYDNLYIQAMPPQNDRNILSALLQNSAVFPPNLIYRYNDPNFGVAKNVTYYHAYGLTAATLDDYVASLNLNHYWKNLVLGSIETAQALDDYGNIIYEIVYSRIIDDLVNGQGQSVNKQVTLPYTIDVNSTPTNVVYPNSLENMRNQVIDTVGQQSNILPRWMLSKQANGSVLGFTPAWIIAYTKPGQSGQIAYNIKTTFGPVLNQIDYQVDRYELDNLLTHNWDREAQQWIPHPPSYTTFDTGSTSIFDNWLNDSGDTVQWLNDSGDTVPWENNYNGQPTVFDGNSLKFIAPVDMYSNTQIYDKYLVFPKRDILE